MALHFIIGRPGGGKSMTATEIIERALRERSHQNIVTNVPLTIGPLVDEKTGRCFMTAVNEKYGETFDAASRIRLLTPEETAEFYLHPGRGLDAKARTALFTRKGKTGCKTTDVPDLSIRDGFGTTLYVIDEAHHYFNARKWAETGEDCLYYISMHRHWGDDIYILTQHPENVEKQFRVIAQDYTELRNLGYESFLCFRIMNKLMRRESLTWPAKSGAFTLHQIDTKYLGRLYRTEGGTGMSLETTKADMGKKNRKISIVWGFAVVLLIGLCLYKMPGILMGKMMGRMLPGVGQKPAAVAPAVAPVAPVAPASLGLLPQSRLPGAPVTNKPVVQIVGYVGALGKYRLYLSDGSSLNCLSARFGGLTPEGAMVDGRELSWRR